MKTKTLKRLFILTTLMMLPLVATAQTCPAAPVGDVKDPVFQLIANASDRFQIGATDSVSSTIRGAMVWDDTNSTIAVCDGTNWVTLGSGGGGANALDDLTDVTNDGDSQLFARGVADPTTMTQSVVIGQNAAVNATGSLTNSVFIGWEAGGRAVNPDGNMLGNTVMGARAGYGLSHNANDNTIIGYQAGQGVENGDENVLIGKLAGSNIVGGGRNIIIGSNTSALGPTVFDTLNIGNTIYGDTSETTVGIGVESPSSTLHVAGDVQIGNSSATCTGTTAGAMRYNGGNIEFCNGTAWGAMGGGGDNLGNHTATQNIQLGSYYLSGDGGDEGITVDSTGQVGIGTAFPSETLHIMGTIRAESNLPIMSLFDINGGVDLKRWDLRVESGGILRVQALSDTGSGGGQIIDFGRSANNVAYAKFGNNIPALYVDVINDDVGIATDSPSSTLHVAGDIQIGNDSATCDSDRAGAIRYNGGVLQFCNGTAWGTLGVAGGGDNLGNHQAGQNIQLGNYYLSGDGDDEGITVANDGKVGVGSGDPAQNLHVYDSAAEGEIIVEGDETKWSGLTLITAGDGQTTHSNAGAKAWSIYAGGENYTNVAQREDLGFSYWNGASWKVPMMIKDGGNVGIGTIEPSTTLHVDGAARAGSFQWEDGVNRITNNDGGGNVNIRFGHEHDGGQVFTHAGGAAEIESNIDNVSNTYLDFRVSSNPGAGTGQPVTWGSLFRISKDDVTFDGTSLLGGGADNLGDHVATQVLDMGYNSISKTSYISVNDGVNSNYGFITEAGLDGIGLTGNSARLNDPEFYVSDSGRIGIGTTAPSTILMIENNGSTVVRARGHDNSAIQGAPYYISEKARGTKAAPLAVQSGDNLAAYEMGGYDGSGYTGATASVKALATENFTNSAHGTALRFETTPEGTITRQTRMYIGADGNVGIGTQAPSSTLHVIGDSYLGAASSVQRTFVSSWGVGSDIDTLLPGSTSGPFLEGGSNSHMVFSLRDNDANDGFYFVGTGGNYGTDNTRDEALMTIQSDGDVGIGTTAPNGTLHVNSTSGDAIYIASGLVNGADIRMGAAGFLLADASVHVGLDGTNSSTTSKFRIVKDVTTDPGSAPSVFDVSESGAVVASGTVTATGFINSSDKRLKDEIRTVMNPLEIVKKLRGVFYKWKDSGRESAGVIAQEVREVLPSAVHEREDGMLAVEYNQLIAPMIEAIKLQQEQIDALKAEVEELKRAQ
ncbi:MAG: tail fiber domain-containing protein [Pseudomonadota bacterium]|nr:tail fiber domain-containing protein [Pseudomonadota bacterium]